LADATAARRAGSPAAAAASAGGGPAPPVIVVGAGIGGLVSALLLACRGLDVTLLERGDAPGGKMRALDIGGVPVDAGPTVFTMRWVFDEILAEAGSATDELVGLQPLSVLARHAWRGHAPVLDLYADAQRSADAIAAFSSPAEGRRFLAFCAEARRVYRRLEGPHIRSERPGFWRMVGDLGPSGLAQLAALGPFATLWRSLGRHFHDPRLRQLFARYATYCGASPWLAPATLMLVAHVEMDGVWSIDGGMATLARRIAGLAAARGVRLRYGAHVEEVLVDGGRAAGVRLAGGEILRAQAVVFNGDANALALGLLGRHAARARRPLPPRERSLSAVTWAMRVRTRGLPLARHNVFFDDDYRSEFDDVLARRQLPQRGTVYLCAQDRLDDRAPPPQGPERLLALVNAPADGDRRRFDASEIDPCQRRSLDLMRECGLQLELPQPDLQTVCRTPADFETLHPGSGGALYGPATHGWMALFRRPSSRSPLPGLYLAGGSAHPGPGVPMAAMSGRLAAATLIADLASTRRSSRVHIAGGTWTPSATTAATR
jgi:1-hydroxycarotenoid 3,4-desaturase